MPEVQLKRLSDAGNLWAVRELEKRKKFSMQKF